MADLARQMCASERPSLSVASATARRPSSANLCVRAQARVRMCALWRKTNGGNSDWNVCVCV